MSSLHSLKKRINKNKGVTKMQNKVQSIAPGILPGVLPNSLRKVTCKCGAEFDKFIPVVQLRHASALQTSHGQPMLINFANGFACAKCGKMNEFDIETTGKEGAELN
jgi:hypothetical protein